MSSNYSATSIELKPRPSALLAWILAGFHLFCAAVVLAYVPSKAAVTVLLLLAYLSWYRAHRLHCQHRGKQAVRHVVWQADGHWWVEDASGSGHQAELLPSSYIHPRLLILNFRLKDRAGKRSLLLLPDSLDAQTLRRLRSRLRIEAAANGDSSLNQA